MEVYRDRVILEEVVKEVSFRRDSIEVNRYRGKVLGIRKCVNGCWYITSCQDCRDFSELVDRSYLVSSDLCSGLAGAELFSGEVRLGNDCFDEEVITKLVRDVCSEARGFGVVNCEAVTTFREVRRSLIRDDGSEAREVKYVFEVEVAGMKLGGGFIKYSSVLKAVIPFRLGDVLKLVDSCLMELRKSLESGGVPKKLPPYRVGKANLVLSNDAVAALFHEVSHLLDPTYVLSIKYLGTQVGPQELKVYDDPYNPLTPTYRVFDDEGVRTFRRVLIDGGRVVDTHNTRSTAKLVGSRPGSAYGLFHKPIPFHTSLVVTGGDWRDSEIIEETKDGYLIDGVVMATLEHGYVRIVPERAYVISKGEVRDLISIREVKIPLTKLRSINAIGKSLRPRVSRERDWLVAEVAPKIRLEGYVY